ncbi:MAG: hypothetical protein K9G26_04535 [Emcibacter sp.]|nr:hypothetical protein [Emcibacter sp.]
MTHTDITQKAAILLCAHGSKSPKAVEEFNHVLSKVQAACPDQLVQGAFLEFNSPTIDEGLEDIYTKGFHRIIVQPLTLYNAGHTINDIPAILTAFKEKYSDVTLHYGKSLGLIDPIIEAARSAIETVMPDSDPEECKLLVVGRGSENRMVADQTINLCRKLHERMGFGDSRYCYPSGNAPLLPSALKQAGLSHYPHVIVLPFLLFSGALLSEIYTEVDRAGEIYPDFIFHKAPHLGTQDNLITAILHHINAIKESYNRI